MAKVKENPKTIKESIHPIPEGKKPLPTPDTNPVDGDKLIDVVYYNGKPNFFEILDPGLIAMYNNRPGREFFANHPVLGKLYEGLTLATSIPSKMITLSPRFAGANIFRDTFTATVNSAFGFIPIWSTMKGLILTNKGIGS